MARKKPASYQELLGVPAHLVAEIVDGELHTSPRPSLAHAMAASSLTSELVGPFGFGRGGGPGGWVILAEPELHIVGQVLVPDLAGWRRERMPQMPDTAFAELAPDWVCEVISPSTGALDRASKMPHYGRAGVGHLWLVDPAAKTVEIFRFDGDGWRLVGAFAENAKVRAEPFDAIELDLSVLWAR
jgi:Putative restriction endonuclease